MIDFVFQNPCKIIFGKNALSHLGEEVLRYGRNVLLVYGGGHIKRMGLYQQVINILAEKQVQVWELGGIRPNPMLSRVYEGIELCRSNNIDLLLAVGGASVIEPRNPLPQGCPTKAMYGIFMRAKLCPNCPASGNCGHDISGRQRNERSSVITKEEGIRKAGFNSLTNVPKFSILNPEYCYTLPPYQTACGVVDMLAHLMERYFTQVEHVMLTDQMLEACMRTVLIQGPIVMERPDDYHARAELMWAAALAHNTLLQTGRVGDWASHKLEHELSALYDIAHGAGLAIVFPAWMKYVLRHSPGKLAQFASQVMGVPENVGDEEDISLVGIRRLESFYRSLVCPFTSGCGHCSDSWRRWLPELLSRTSWILLSSSRSRCAGCLPLDGGICVPPNL